jgi:hypothetical protein
MYASGVGDECESGRRNLCNSSMLNRQATRVNGMEDAKSSQISEYEGPGEHRPLSPVYESLVSVVTAHRANFSGGESESQAELVRWAPRSSGTGSSDDGTLSNLVGVLKIGGLCSGCRWADQVSFSEILSTLRGCVVCPQGQQCSQMDWTSTSQIIEG